MCNRQRETSIRCDLKNLLDEKGIRFNYLDMKDMPHDTMTCLKKYCSSYRMLLSVHYFSTLMRHWNIFIRFETHATHATHATQPTQPTQLTHEPQ